MLLRWTCGTRLGWSQWRVFMCTALLKQRSQRALSGLSSCCSIRIQLLMMTPPVSLSSLSSTDYRKYTHSLEICQNLSKLHKSTHDRWKTDSPKLALCLVRLCTYKFNCRSIKCLYLLIIKLSVRDNFLFVTAHGSHRFVTCNFNDAWTKKTYCSIRTWELKTTRDLMMPPPPHVCNM